MAARRGPTGAPRAAVYASKGVNSRHDKVLSSLRTQIDDCLLAAEREGYRFAGVFAEVTQHLSLEGRPELDRLRAAVRAGQIDVVYCWDITRLGGTGDEVAAFWDELESRGCRLRFVHGEEEQAALARKMEAFLERR